MSLCSAEFRELAIPEVRWTQAPANACSSIYAWHFSDRFLWENYSTSTGGHHHELTTVNVTLVDRSLKHGLVCWRDGQRFSLDGSLIKTAYKPYQNWLSHAWIWFNRLTALSTFSNSLSLVVFRSIFACKWSANLCMWRLPDIVHWFADKHNISIIQWYKSYFKYEPS